MNMLTVTLLTLLVVLSTTLFALAGRVSSDKSGRAATISSARAKAIAKLASGLVRIGGLVRYDAPSFFTKVDKRPKRARLVGIVGRANKPMALLVGAHGRQFRRPFTTISAT